MVTLTPRDGYSDVVAIVMVGGQAESSDEHRHDTMHRIHTRTYLGLST